MRRAAGPLFFCLVVDAFSWGFSALLDFPISRFLVLPGASLGSLPAAIASLGRSGLIGLPKGSQTVKLVRFGVTSSFLSASSASRRRSFYALLRRRSAVDLRRLAGQTQDPSHARFCGSCQRSCPDDDGALTLTLSRPTGEGT